MNYKANAGVSSHYNWWVATTVLFFLLSVFSLAVALHNSKPLTCDDVIWDPHNNVHVCEVTIK